MILINNQVFYVSPDGTCASINQTHEFAIKANIFFEAMEKVCEVFNEVKSAIENSVKRVCSILKQVFEPLLMKKEGNHKYSLKQNYFKVQSVDLPKVFRHQVFDRRPRNICIRTNC